jgi:DNA repair protein RecN (Recombination protein N)
MERTTVKVTISEVAPSPDGVDRIEILIAPNRGEEPKPMQRIASGGELSRIQLAIAAALFRSSTHAAAATLVFDEIDAGIGGRVAEVVGRKLEQLAARNQVICVTHLPQIASFGSTHFYVWKDDANGHTRARIRRLDTAEERVGEIARMLGGEKITDSAIAHARELLTR